MCVPRSSSILLIYIRSPIAISLPFRSYALVRCPLHLVIYPCLLKARASLSSLRHHPIPRIHLVHPLIYPIRAFSRTQDIRDVNTPPHACERLFTIHRPALILGYSSYVHPYESDDNFEQMTLTLTAFCLFAVRSALCTLYW